MPNGARHEAHAAFVQTIRRLAGKYGLRAGEGLTPRTPRQTALAAYTKRLPKVHPDKGGDPEDLRAPKEAEAAFSREGPAAGRKTLS